MNLSLYISLVFGLTTIVTLILFFNSIKKSTLECKTPLLNVILFVLFTWLTLQAILAWSGVYATDLNSLPPKIVLFGILPLLVLFFTSKGRRFRDSLPLKQLTYLNVVRLMAKRGVLK